MRRGISVLIFLILSSIVMANLGHLYDVDSNVVKFLRMNYTLNGDVLPYETEPFSAFQIQDLSRKFETCDRNLTILLRDEKIRDGFKFFVKLNPTISTNNWDYTLPSTFVDLEQAFRYYSLPSFFEFGGEINALNGMNLLIDVNITREFANYYTSDDGNLIHFTENLSPIIDGNIPFRGYFSYQAKDFSLIFGRQKIKWGPGLDSLTIGSASPYYDTFSMRVGSDGRLVKKFNYSFTFIGIDPHLTEEEWEIQKSVEDLSDKVYTDEFKGLIAHRVDFLFTHNFRLGLTEMCLIGGKYPDLQILNPFILFHNTYYFGFTNILAGFDLSYSPVPGFLLYSDVAFDDIKLPNEKNGNPTSYGIILGGRYTQKIMDFILGISYEFSRTSRWFYNRSVPYLKYTNRIYNVSHHPEKNLIVDFPIGYSYGPDALSHKLILDFMAFPRFSLSLGFEFLSKGPYTLFTPFLEEPVGNTFPENSLILSFNLKAKRLFFDWLNLNLGGDVRLVGNIMDQDGVSELNTETESGVLFNINLGLGAEWEW